MSVIHPHYSIIICSYNPDEKILTRCLNAVAALDTSGLSVEFILVDNNSKTSLINIPAVAQFLKTVPASRTIVEKKQGLHYARMAGLSISSGDWIVFFDDDNEPTPNYLQALIQLNNTHTEVGAWGPGIVEVDFTDKMPEAHIIDYTLQVFQKRNSDEIEFSNQNTWQSCYPFGTGLSIKRQYIERYASLFQQGAFTLSDRKGNSLSSGGDTQLVLYVISCGAHAGVAPELELTHMIPAKRTTFDYLRRLCYGTSVCYSTCLAEVFPEHKESLRNSVMARNKFVRRAAKRFFASLVSKDEHKTLHSIGYMGGIAGDYTAIGKPVPPLINWMLERLKAK